jgi:hypothetical protein
MNVAGIESAEPQAERELDVLSYEAPFLIDMLVEERIAEDEAEARVLFREVKRFLVLVRCSHDLSWDMYSRRVDEAWHQFVLFTREYIQFCMRFFGSYVQHRPRSAPADADEGQPASASSFHAFRARYEAFYGVPLPDVWYDDKCVTPRRRVINDNAGRLAVREGEGMVSLVSPSGEVLLTVNSLGSAALRFIARTDAFYVRELPGDLSDEEQVLLAATLVELQVLRVAP